MSTTMGSTTASEKEKGFRLLQAQRARKAAEVREYRGKGAGPKFVGRATEKNHQHGTAQSLSQAIILFSFSFWGERKKNEGWGERRGGREVNLTRGRSRTVVVHLACVFVFLLSCRAFNVDCRWQFGDSVFTSLPSRVFHTVTPLGWGWGA